MCTQTAPLFPRGRRGTTTRVVHPYPCSTSQAGNRTRVVAWGVQSVHHYTTGPAEAITMMEGYKCDPYKTHDALDQSDTGAFFGTVWTVCDYPGKRFITWSKSTCAESLAQLHASIRAAIQAYCIKSVHSGINLCIPKQFVCGNGP